MRIVALGLAGIVVAAVLGFAAHLIARDTVGLSATQLRAGTSLAPPDATRTQSTSEPGPGPRGLGRRFEWLGELRLGKLGLGQLRQRQRPRRLTSAAGAGFAGARSERLDPVVSRVKSVGLRAN